jgi:ABC-2 type transport system ATP-binding protein
MIRFALPPGVSADQVGNVVGAPVEASGNQVTTRTEHPQRTLYKLTGWAEEKGIELAGLEARRPTLEDVFLELTGDGGAPQPSGDGDGGTASSAAAGARDV